VWANVTRLMREYISKDDYPKLASLLTEEVNPVLFIRLDELTERARSIFGHALKKAYQEAKAAGPSSFRSQSSIQGLWPDSENYSRWKCLVQKHRDEVQFSYFCQSRDGIWGFATSTFR
jgi:hypothetical protein